MLSLFVASLLAAAPLALPEEPKAQHPLSLFDRNVVTFQADGQSFVRPMQEQEFQRQLLGDGQAAWVLAGANQPNLALAGLDEAARGQLGVPAGRGLVVTSVRPQGPAFEAGIREQDVLLTLNDEPLAQPDDLEKLLKKAGDAPATLALLRKKQPTTLKVQAQVHVDLGPATASKPAYWIGASVEQASPLLREQLLDGGTGLVVTQLAEGSPASKAGLQAHDIILFVDGKSIPDAPALIERVSENGEKPLNVEILRSGETKSLSITPEKRPDAGKRITLNLQNGLADDPSNYLRVIRPGAVVDQPVAIEALLAKEFAGSTARAQAAGADAGRIDQLAAEVKALREAVESLLKSLADKK